MTTAYEAAHESAALFDWQTRAKVELAGRDAREFLHNLCTQDVKNLAVGDTREAFLTTAKARVIAHLWITHRETNVLLLDFAAGQAEKVLEHLNRYLISEQVEVVDRTNDVGMLRIVGPRAAELLTSTTVTPTRSHRLLAVDGFDLICPATDALALRQRLLAGGAVLGDDAAYDILRVEAGLPEFGIDIDEDRLAMEVNRPDAISYTKGCYLGQETIVMARDRGQVNRKLMGVKIAAGKPPVSGTKVLREGAEVGHVTSAVFSPMLGSVIALAYLRRGAWDAGTAVTLHGQEGVVSVLPFDV